MGYLVIADFFGDGGARYAFALSPKLRPLVVPYLPNQYEFHDRRRVIYTSVATPYRTGQGLAKGLGCSFYKATAYDKSTALEDWVWLRWVDRRSWGQETRRTWLDQGMTSLAALSLSHLTSAQWMLVISRKALKIAAIMSTVQYS
jgi:hypothetical protein